jgi:isoleucyl-tRNA synthetase
VVVTQTPKEGWTVASDGGETVALETSLTPELRREGLAREAIRLIQDARKSDGLDVTDRIELWWEASGPELPAALEEQGTLIANEVLATRYQDGRPGAEAGAGVHQHRDSGLGLNFWLRKA